MDLRPYLVALLCVATLCASVLHAPAVALIMGGAACGLWLIDGLLRRRLARPSFWYYAGAVVMVGGPSLGLSILCMLACWALAAALLYVRRTEPLVNL